jgi:hypothetical protein
MIRKGLMTREEALKRLDFSQYKEDYMQELRDRVDEKKKQKVG